MGDCQIILIMRFLAARCRQEPRAKVSTELPVGSTKGVVTVDWRSTVHADLSGTASTVTDVWL